MKSEFSHFKNLIKLRLSLSVIFSSVMAFFIAGKGENIDYYNLAFLFLGGFLITAAANIFNEMIEVETDGLMDRTNLRPLPSKKMVNGKALVLGILFTLLGSFFLLMINFLICLLSIISIVLYAFIYTPIKKIHPVAVLIGALPGALPVLIGFLAKNHHPNITLLSIILFTIQFLWQFPHFWAIAWLLYEDYKKAGIFLLPSKTKNNKSLVVILFSCYTLLGFSYVPFHYGMIDTIGLIVLISASLPMFYFSHCLLLKKKNKYAKYMLFSSFIFLPISFTSFLL